MIFDEALEKYGESAQIVKTLGELSDLSKALCQYHLHLNVLPQDNYEWCLELLKKKVIEEMADVKIMLMQLEVIVGVKEVETSYTDKLRKLKKEIRYPDNA